MTKCNLTQEPEMHGCVLQTFSHIYISYVLIIGTIYGLHVGTNIVLSFVVRYMSNYVLISSIGYIRTWNNNSRIHACVSSKHIRTYISPPTVVEIWEGSDKVSEEQRRYGTGV